MTLSTDLLNVLLGFLLLDESRRRVVGQTRRREVLVQRFEARIALEDAGGYRWQHFRLRLKGSGVLLLDELELSAI